MGAAFCSISVSDLFRSYVTPTLDRMGKLLDAFARVRMNDKLKRGRCLNCKTTLPDNHPAEAEQACSDECAIEVMESRQW